MLTLPPPSWCIPGVKPTGKMASVNRKPQRLSSGSLAFLFIICLLARATPTFPGRMLSFPLGHQYIFPVTSVHLPFFVPLQNEYFCNQFFSVWPGAIIRENIPIASREMSAKVCADVNKLFEKKFERVKSFRRLLLARPLSSDLLSLQFPVLFFFCFFYFQLWHYASVRHS